MTITILFTQDFVSTIASKEGYHNNINYNNDK